MAQWTSVGPASDFAEGQHVCTTAAGKAVVIFNVGGAFYAIRNLCPHAGLPLGEGDRRGHVITCPFHGYAYDIKSGRNVDWPEDEAPVQTFPVRIVDGQVEIELPEKSA